MGGVDVSLGTIASAIRGGQNWGKNNAINEAANKANMENAATVLRAQWGFGDEAAKEQLNSILSGDTRLAIGNGFGEAQTIKENGQRVVYLNNYSDTMSREDMFMMGVTLGHEAYRDGVVGTEQQQFVETAQAVIGHTAMALRMQSDARYTELMGNVIANNNILSTDIEAYKSGDMMAMLGHVAGNYDWSADYWKLTKNGGLEYDGDGWLKDENGNYINKDGSKTDAPINGNTVGSAGIETGLLEILALEKTEENITRVQNMMIEAGLTHTIDANDPENRAAWMWKGAGTEGNANVTIGQSLLSGFGMVHLPRTMFSFPEQFVALQFKQNANAQTTPTDVQPGYPSWPKQQEGYEKLPGQTDETWCNLASYRTDESIYGTEIASRILESRGIDYTNANQMGLNLVEVYSQLDSGWRAQYFANMGELVKMSFVHPLYDPSSTTNPSGHMATVVASYGTYIPALGPRISQAGLENGEMWARYSNAFGSKVSLSKYYWATPYSTKKSNR